MSENIKKIDLSKYKNNGAKFVVGRENGMKARKQENLDDLVKQCEEGKLEKIQFITKESIYGVVSSFILGMLSEIVTKINNRDEVYSIFDFSYLDEELQKQFYEEIDYILGK